MSCSTSSQVIITNCSSFLLFIHGTLTVKAVEICMTQSSLHSFTLHWQYKPVRIHIFVSAKKCWQSLLNTDMLRVLLFFMLHNLKDQLHASGVP